MELLRNAQIGLGVVIKVDRIEWQVKLATSTHRWHTEQYCD